MILSDFFCKTTNSYPPQPRGFIILSIVMKSDTKC